MTIISRATYDRQVVKDLNMEDVFGDNVFSDRANFSGFPNSPDKDFLLNAVSIGALPAQKTSNDRVIFTDTDIIVEVEWLDQEQCQAWVNMRNRAPLPMLRGYEMVIS